MPNSAPDPLDPLDPLDALLASALQESSENLPDAGFTARVSAQIRVQKNRARWLRPIPFFAGLVPGLFIGYFRPHAFDLPPMSLQIPVGSLENVEAALRFLQLTQPSSILAVSLAIIAALGATLAGRRQPDFRW